ncbi:hypothetical protein H257_09083 [Aphanomyces astaci]|uniref:Uncharacterized protein n=1 Tax=Aphanomyces astaci TaxID=112090 RepID=W4GD46_APHAT|nr:hypothetical protein H257_09083 [Aphanomyces astaci]ETV77196.1 hypothetical protein H257_09083 [Aphanomyces astaci]|eukprot:XP_009833502.1 hypothetical protein H257_09083 [Aphanomyces astaci]
MRLEECAGLGKEQQRRLVGMVVPFEHAYQNETAEQRLIRHQASVIDHFIDIGRLQEERLQALEEKLQTCATPKRKESEVKVGQVMPNSKGKRQKQSYMKLFLPNGFVLDEDSQTFRDDVLSTGAAAQIAALEFLRSNNVQSKGTSAVLKALQGTHRLGHRNARIIHYRQLVHLDE